jgi:hypothetical protein
VRSFFMCICSIKVFGCWFLLTATKLTGKSSTSKR